MSGTPGIGRCRCVTSCSAHSRENSALRSCSAWTSAETSASPPRRADTARRSLTWAAEMRSPVLRRHRSGRRLGEPAPEDVPRLGARPQQSPDQRLAERVGPEHLAQIRQDDHRQIRQPIAQGDQTRPHVMARPTRRRRVTAEPQQMIALLPVAVQRLRNGRHRARRGRRPRACSSRWSWSTETPASIATSSRRRPGVRRRGPAGSPSTKGTAHCSRRRRRKWATPRRSIIAPILLRPRGALQGRPLPGCTGPRAERQGPPGCRT